MPRRKNPDHKTKKRLRLENLEKRELLAADFMQQSPLNANDFQPTDAPPTVMAQGPRGGANGQPPTDQESLSESEFASIDGTGNNLENPDLGSAGETLIRAAEAAYADGFSEPAGTDRPSAREISNLLASDEGLTSDRLLSAFVYVWGQFVDHDITRTPSGEESFDISVPTGDEYFDPLGTGSQSISLNRSVYDPETGVETPREQINTITAWLDGSVVYGSDDVTAIALRTLSGGRLKTSDGDLLPYNNAETFPNGTLPMDNDAGIVPDEELFAAGDVRANENIELTALQNLFVREHNRLADEIAVSDSTLTDEEIYQRARSIVVGELQAITYNEWLPSFLGERAISRYAGYDSTVDPTITNEFSTAAFRFGHSLLGDDVEFLDNEGNEIAEEIPLSHAFSNPALVTENGIDSIIKYLASDPSSEIDIQVVDSVRNFLFGPPGAGGFDLASLNIQRGRGHGLSDYNSSRIAYGLESVASFADITSDPEMQAKLEQLYGSVDNIDLWVGGLVEDHVDGASVGETFGAIVADQFERLRNGDRFWYQNVFSGARLRQIERTSLSDVIERNTDLTDLQEDVFFFDSSISGMVTADANGFGSGDSRSVGIADQLVRLVNDGEVVAETSTDSRGRYRFGVLDGLRTGQYEVHLISRAAVEASTVAVEEVSITTGNVHLRNVNFSIHADNSDEENGRGRRPLRADLADPIFAADDDDLGRRQRGRGA